MRPVRPKLNGHQVPAELPHYRLRLYVAGQSPRSLVALANLRRLCDVHLAGRCKVEVVDLMAEPGRARTDQIIAIPTLVRRWPPPLLRQVGDLSDSTQLLAGLELLTARTGG